MDIQIDKIFDVLTKFGFEAFIVGGAVRDIVMGLEPHDFDLATNALPRDIIEIFESEGFKVVPTGIQHGTVTVIVDDIPFEITTYRIDTNCDGRRCEVRFTRSLQEDLIRRDFTINALALDKDNNIIDLVNGLNDINNRIIRTVGNPIDRFNEDYLRMLRAIRFSSRLNFNIDPNTYKAIKLLSSNLSKISKERIRDEFGKILLSKGRVNGILSLLDTEMMDIIIPEFSELALVEQPVIFHPEGNVLNHSILSLAQTQENDSLTLILATLLHDIGKLDTQEFDIEKGRITFLEHDSLGAEKSKIILTDLKFDTQTIENTSWLISNHMKFHEDVTRMRKSTIKKLMLIKTDGDFIPNPLFDDLVKLMKYDILGSDKDLINYNNLLIRINEIREEIIRQPPKRLITGFDVIKLGIKPGPIIGDLMSRVEDAQLEGIVTNRDEALQFLRSLIGFESK